MQLTTLLRREFRKLSLVRLLVGCGWLIIFAVLETAGRKFSNDLADGAALLCVSYFVLVTALIHRSHPIHTVAAIQTGVKRLAQRLWSRKVELGVDFTQFPPLPRQIPRRWAGTVLTLLIVVPILALMAGLFPTAARSFLIIRSALLCLTAEAVLWVLIAVGTLVHAILIWARLHDWLVQKHRGPARRSIRFEARMTIAIYVALMFAAALFPPLIALGVQAGLFVILTTALLASNRGLELIWRDGDGGAVKAFDGRWSLWLSGAGSILLSMVITLLATGDSLTVGVETTGLESMPVTLLLGRVFAWASLAGNAVVTFYALRFAVIGVLFRRGSTRHRQSETERRRGEIQCRREIVRRLQMLFRIAAGQKRRQGSGIWIALQHWFVLGLSRDHEDDKHADRDSTVFDEIIGPPYHRVFSGNARRHFLRITQCLGIDLIYVERGISYQRLVRVLRMMFEIYDIHGGRERAEEYHFTGLPGVRVVIHDFDLERSPKHGREQYPEPDYEQVGRARILHIFKDRGEATADESTPESWRDAPITSGV